MKVSVKSSVAFRMATPPPPPEEAETPGCVVKEIERKLYKTLKDVFKYDSYRSLVQKRAVEAVANSSQDVFVSMPTGAGKSLCFQLPALVSERKGVTIVVSPLIALMTNQMDQMKALGICTETINSKMLTSERERVKADLTSKNPKTKMLYITPELASTQGFYSLMDHLYKINCIARIVVDEAHCVSQWGHSFRPDYIRLGQLREKYMSVPWVALTATASIQVMDDILLQLKLSHPVSIFKTSCFRPNIYYDVVFKEIIDDPCEDLARFAFAALGEHWEMSPPNERGCGIVYCRTRDGCEELAHKLTKLGLMTEPYHAGIKPTARKTTQSNWMEGKIPVIAATVSFGMGIDKASVRFVAHWCVSQSPAGYYQESGRAGRDGKPSRCRIYYSRKDRDTILFLLKKDASTAKSNTVKTKIGMSIKSFNTMIKYCEETMCRHYLLAREFGDDINDCRKCCDVCTNSKLVTQKISAFKSLFLGSKIKSVKTHDTSDLYGGGRAGIQKECQDYGGESGEEGSSREKEASAALSNLISEEFKKRRGAKEKADKNKRTKSTKVLEPLLNKIPEVTVIMREKYFDKLVEELRAHLKSCASNDHCPSLTENEIHRCAADTEWNFFSSKGNIHMYRREIVYLTKSLREASRQVEIHPVVTKFIANSNSSHNTKSGGKERLHTIVDYFSKKKSNCVKSSENRSSSLSVSSLSPLDNDKKNYTQNNTHCDNFETQKSKTFHDTDSDKTDKCSPRKSSKSKTSESSRSSIEEEKPIMKYFFESVCPTSKTSALPASPNTRHTKDISIISPTSRTTEKSETSTKRSQSSSPSKHKRKKISHSPETDKSSYKSEKNKSTLQTRNDNLKKAADLVRKHLNPEYKSKRISKDLFKIVCRSISHRLVEADAVNDTAAKCEVEKLLHSQAPVCR